MAKAQRYFRFGDPRTVQDGQSMIHDPLYYEQKEEYFPTSLKEEREEGRRHQQSEEGISALNLSPDSTDDQVVILHPNFYQMVEQLNGFLLSRLIDGELYTFEAEPVTTSQGEPAAGTDGEPLIDAKTIKNVQKVRPDEVFLSSPNRTSRRELDRSIQLAKEQKEHLESSIKDPKALAQVLEAVDKQIQKLQKQKTDPPGKTLARLVKPHRLEDALQPEESGAGVSPKLTKGLDSDDPKDVEKFLGHLKDLGEIFTTPKQQKALEEAKWRWGGREHHDSPVNTDTFWKWMEETYPEVRNPNEHGQKDWITPSTLKEYAESTPKGYLDRSTQSRAQSQVQQYMDRFRKQKWESQKMAHAWLQRHVWKAYRARSNRILG